MFYMLLSQDESLWIDRNLETFFFSKQQMPVCYDDQCFVSGYSSWEIEYGNLLLIFASVVKINLWLLPLLKQ